MLLSSWPSLKNIFLVNWLHVNIPHGENPVVQSKRRKTITIWWMDCRLLLSWLNFSFRVPGAFYFFIFFTYLIQRFGLVILRLKLEPVVINVALVFHVPTLDYDLSFLAADGVMSTLVMTKTASKVSMRTWNLCWNNAVASLLLITY